MKFGLVATIKVIFRFLSSIQNHDSELLILPKNVYN